MNTKHTPGPWENINGQIGTMIDGRRNYTYVASVDSGFSDEEASANAHLIAAAPDLLEALQNAIGVCQAFSTQSTTAKICADKAEYAIRKALGVAK